MKYAPTGSIAHSKMVSEGRHPGVQTAMAWLCYSHLRATLQSLSAPIYQAAVELIERIPNDSAELTTALNALVEAKDWMVRAGIRSDQGTPGPVPRLAEVVDPPFSAVEQQLQAEGRAALPGILPGQSPEVVDPAGDPFQEAAPIHKYAGPEA